ncbi:YgjV family protein [Candidatus Saccharibacteria bacterium]|nr:YgjV family protein [Candidatus Saccharibacteria bacterium]
MLFWVAQIVGGVALLFGVLTFQCKRRQTMLQFQVVETGSWVVQYFLLGALAGAALNFISLIRSVVFYYLDKKQKRPVWLLIVIMALGAIVSILTWQDWRSAFALIGWLIFTLSLWQENPQTIRKLTLLQVPFWLVYGIAVGAIPSVLNEIFIFTSASFGLWRFRHKRKMLK